MALDSQAKDNQYVSNLEKASKRKLIKECVNLKKAVEYLDAENKKLKSRKKSKEIKR